MKATISENKNQVDKELKRIDEILETISSLHGQINLIIEKISDLYVYGDDQVAIQRELEQLESSVDKINGDCHSLSQNVQEAYSKQQGFVPTDIQQELKSLGLAAENMKGVMADKDREFKRAKTVRSEYLSGVDFIQIWLQQAELRIQDRTLEPVLLKQLINNVQKELSTIYEKMDTTKQCAVIILNNIQSDDEKKLIQNTVDQLEKQIEQIRSELEDKKHQLHDSLDACTRFMKLYENVMRWAAEKRELISISLAVTTLTEVRQKMNEYMVDILVILTENFKML